MSNGWVRIHRKMLNNPIICKDSDHMYIWVYLLLNATHQERDVFFKGARITLKGGQLLAGRKSIAKETNISESKVQRILKTLEIEQQIEQQASNQNRLISIINWGKYQSIPAESEQRTEQRMNNGRTTDEQRMNTNNNVIMRECNNERKDKKIMSFENDEYQKILNVWNNFAEKNNLKKIQAISEKRKRAINARSKNKAFDLQEIFNKIKSSDFLLGKNKEWQIDFDFIFCSANNYLKILEGNYTNKKNNFLDEIVQEARGLSINE